jgi:putative nucleotidyltransferase with HDIG domain
MPGLFRHPLDSRVGRRIAAVAVVSVLVPLALFGSVVFARARDQIQAQEQERLHLDTKTAALYGLARLRMLEEELRWLAPLMSAQPRAEHQQEVSGMLARAEALSVVPAPDGPRGHLKGDDVPPGMTDGQARHLHGVGALLMPGPDATSNWLIVGAPSGSQAAARVSTATIFGLDGASSFPSDYILCLRAPAAHVTCSDSDVRTVLAVNAAALPAHGQATVNLGGATHSARTWALPLQAEYHAGVWTVVMLAPRAKADATLWQLERDLMLLTASALIVVVLAVLTSVRRNLRPLSALEAAADKVGRQHYDVQLHVTTGDEFETLAAGFNGMVTAIRAHVEDIEAFSVGAATALARTIDAKSPWTAGHSERVTAMSLEIARILGLPEADLVVLHRGGLLHDIGKLATPSEILDKPGRLTPEERRIIEQHPRDGVRILEPIADFAPLLPIVLEHHERIDGQGYPDGKAGQDIHHLARVLAVADVYDALISDRPYRPGLAKPAALEIVRAGTGSQFDPVVVDAFLRIVTANPPSPPLLDRQPTALSCTASR